MYIVSILDFVAQWAYPVGCLIFFATNLSPSQQVCAAVMALSVVLGRMYFWILLQFAHFCFHCIVLYGVPVSVLVVASLADQPLNGICVAVAMASVFLILYRFVQQLRNVVFGPANGKAAPTSTTNVGPSSVVERH